MPRDDKRQSLQAMTDDFGLMVTQHLDDESLTRLICHGVGTNKDDKLITLDRVALVLSLIIWKVIIISDVETSWDGLCENYLSTLWEAGVGTTRPDLKMPS